MNNFIEEDGIQCLLNILRICLNRQQSPGTNRISGADAISISRNKSLRSKDRHNHLKRALVSHLIRNSFPEHLSSYLY